jgi:hypothetical protein
MSSRLNISDDNGGKMGWIGCHSPVQQRIAAGDPLFPNSSIAFPKN